MKQLHQIRSKTEIYDRKRSKHASKSDQCGNKQNVKTRLIPKMGEVPKKTKEIRYELNMKKENRDRKSIQKIVTNYEVKRRDKAR